MCLTLTVPLLLTCTCLPMYLGRWARYLGLPIEVGYVPSYAALNCPVPVDRGPARFIAVPTVLVVPKWKAKC
ncbi:hypothetical protein F4823DRAFT_405536 [Ustulina deusta]|nr:hypothetical protein F4823DRAFT_405536 [Ustulina deusta]